MHHKGIHLLPGLPNTTSCSQEMDNWFQDVKGKYDAHSQDLFEQKTYDHAMALKNWQGDGETKIKGAALTKEYFQELVGSWVCTIYSHCTSPQECLADAWGRWIK